MTSKGTRCIAVVLAVAVVMGAGGCTQSGTTSAKKPESGGAAASSDSSLEAWAEVKKALADKAPNAMLMAVGTQGVVFADVPGSWSFILYDPDAKHLWRVYVEHGKPDAPEDMGPVQQELTVSAGTDIESIEVGGAEAAKLARDFGEKAGGVPANVMVGASFAAVKSAAESRGGDTAWEVTFLEGTSGEGAVKFLVDMMSGEVTAAPDE